MMATSKYVIGLSMMALPCYAQVAEAGAPGHAEDGIIYVVVMVLALLLAWIYRKLHRARIALRAVEETAQASLVTCRHQEEALKQIREQLSVQERHAAIGYLTGGVAQELNNPANFISGGAQNLNAMLMDFKEYLKTLAGDDAEPQLQRIFEKRFHDLHEQVENMREGTERISKVAMALNDLSRGGSGGPRVVDLRQGLSNLVELLRRVFLDVRFEVYLDEPLLCECRPVDLYLAMMHILRNGCEAMVGRQNQPSDPSSRVLRLEGRCDRDMAKIVVIDRGPGIPEAYRKRIFEPFFTTEQRSGLGLSVAWDTIRDYGGMIEVTSDGETGTRFEVSLPSVGSNAESLADVG